MRAGQLRQRLDLERRTRTPDGGGGFEEGWTVIEDGLSARVVQKTGSESVMGDTLSGIVTHTVYLRASSRTSGITNLHRLVDRRSGEIHDIKAVTHDERQRVMVLTTQTGGRD